ncbi:MAG: hypothetical protein IJ946_02405 [Clostridia bacterium]|nr:hypothetical protein [Clostridia bacterium]
MEDLKCYFSNEGQALINSAISVKLKSAEVLNVYVDVEPVNFNRGFYSCDLTFFFLIKLEVFTTPHSMPEDVRAIATFSKKVILFGSEGTAKVFSNLTSLENASDLQLQQTENTPRCVVQTVDPIALAARICKADTCNDNICCIPKCICDVLGGGVAQNGDNNVYVTIGLFTVVQLIRNVQMLIPIYDFCIPEKQCTDNCAADQPCDVFRRIQFPTDDFFPPSLSKDCE